MMTASPGQCLEIPRADRGSTPTYSIQARDRSCSFRTYLELLARDDPRLIREDARWEDHGSSYVSAELAEWLEAQNMGHVRGAPYHPQTQGKIEHWHQTLKNRIFLENYYLPGDLEASVGRFVAICLNLSAPLFPSSLSIAVSFSVTPCA
jgi:transposase InsO family protein